MPKPITKAWWNEFRKSPSNLFYFTNIIDIDNGCRLRLKKHHILGFYIFDTKDADLPYSYSINRYGEPIWITSRAFQRRAPLGFPKPRGKRRHMKDISIFSMDEMELAQSIMEGLE